WGALSPLLQRARSPAIHTPESVQLPGLPIPVQRHLGHASPRDASFAKNLAAGQASDGPLHSWRQSPQAVPVARGRLPKRLAPGAEDPGAHGCGSASGTATHRGRRDGRDLYRRQAAQEERWSTAATGTNLGPWQREALRIGGCGTRWSSTDGEGC